MDLTLKLPAEIVFLILSYLDGDDIFPCLAVSKRWRNILNSDDFWKKLCLKARIFDPVFTFRDPSPLCSWAEAYYCYRFIPLYNWKHGRFKCIKLPREESEHYCDAWDGHIAAVYYYTLGNIKLYSIYKETTLKQVIKVKLPRKESYNNASLSLNDPYIVVARFNVAIILKKTNVYTAIQTVSVTTSFSFGFNLSNRNTKLGAEIAWGYLWMKADPVKDTFIINLKDFSTKYITGKPHLAFNDNVKLVIAWTKSSVRVATLKGDILLALNRNKIRSIDYNSKILAVRVENNIEIINIKTGETMWEIKASEKFEFGLCNSTLILLEGNKMCSMSCLSIENRNKIWSVNGLNGRASDLRCVGSKYYFVVPSFSKWNYCLIDSKGNVLREDVLPECFDQFPSPVFNETLPFFVVTNEETFDIISFM